jgi:hypothetical protein
MRTSDFLQVYPREMTERQIHQGVAIPEVREAQQYSYGYGLLAHAALRGEQEKYESLLPPLHAYETTHEYNDLEKKLLDTPGGWEYRNEVNFCSLNNHMQDMWVPMLLGEWPKSLNRHRVIDVAMNSLAVDGLMYYTSRHLFAKKYGTEALYSEDGERFLQRFTGALQELDVAIVVLDVIRKHPNLTVVPAPLQFERTSSGANADLLVVDVAESRAVGVQTKTTIDKQRAEKYDSSRVAIVDGTIDLGNVRVVRTKRGRSLEQPKPWPGIVAASRVDAIKLHGKSQHVPPNFIRRFAANKMMAREVLGSLRVDTHDLSKLIADRIITRL